MPDDIMKEIERGLDKEAITSLLEGILAQAVEDYLAALNDEYVDGKEPSFIINDCENFFRSDRFRELTNLDGSGIPEKLQLRSLEEAETMFEDALVHASSFDVQIKIYEKVTKKTRIWKLPNKYAKEVKDLMWTQLRIIKKKIKEAEKCTQAKNVS